MSSTEGIPPRAPGLVASKSDAPAAARLWGLALGAGLLAGVAAWALTEASLEAFVPRARMVQAMGVTVNLPSFADKAAAARKNATLAYGVLGASLGVALGLAGGLAQRSATAALLAAAAGAVLGAAGGAGAGAAVVPLYYQREDQAQEDLSHDLVVPLLVHGGAWAAVGAAGGAALGLGLGGRRIAARSALGGLAGGVLGALAYEVIGALAFPGDRTTQPVAAAWAPRLLAALSVSLLTAAVAVITATAPGRKGRSGFAP